MTLQQPPDLALEHPGVQPTFALGDAPSHSLQACFDALAEALVHRALLLDAGGRSA
jgi:hypothetical protein